jgi:hypothetical protein
MARWRSSAALARLLWRGTESQLLRQEEIAGVRAPRMRGRKISNSKVAWLLSFLQLSYWFDVKFLLLFCKNCN